jgi:hypothetical protein
LPSFSVAVSYSGKVFVMQCGGGVSCECARSIRLNINRMLIAGRQTIKNYSTHPSSITVGAHKSKHLFVFCVHAKTLSLSKRSKRTLTNTGAIRRTFAQKQSGSITRKSLYFRILYWLLMKVVFLDTFF